MIDVTEDIHICNDCWLIIMMDPYILVFSNLGKAFLKVWIIYAYTVCVHSGSIVHTGWRLVVGPRCPGKSRHWLVAEIWVTATAGNTHSLTLKLPKSWIKNWYWCWIWQQIEWDMSEIISWSVDIQWYQWYSWSPGACSAPGLHLYQWWLTINHTHSICNWWVNNMWMDSGNSHFPHIIKMIPIHVIKQLYPIKQLHSRVLDQHTIYISI